MKLKISFCCFLTLLLLWCEIQAIWPKLAYIPKTLKFEAKHLKETKKDSFSEAFPILVSKFKKNNPKIVETYCRFLLGAFKECMAKYHSEFRPSFKTWNKAEKSLKTTTISPLMSTLTTTGKLLTPYEKTHNSFKKTTSSPIFNDFFMRPL